MITRSCAFLLAAMVGVTGCAGNKAPQETAAKVPKVEINAKAEQVKPALVQAMLGRGYDIEEEGNYKLTFTKPVTGFADNMKIALRGIGGEGVSSNFAVDYYVTEKHEKTTVVGSMYVLAKSVFGQKGKSFSKELMQQNSAKIQEFLDAVKKDVETK